MDLIFHEMQDGALCAQHCLNNLLQGDYYSAVDLAHIAEELDRQEHMHMSVAGTQTREFEQFLKQGSSNYDDSGFFSIQVLQKALESWNLELVPYQGQNELANHARTNPIGQQAYICNFREHWYTIRKIANYWFNLNSIFKKPQLISDTYLAILLAQLQNDGYSIFIVSGDLPKSPAESALRLNPLNVKDVLANQKPISGSRGGKKSRGFEDEDDDDNDVDDDELKRAIKMSLIENDIDLDKNRMAYPSLAHEQVQVNDYGQVDEEEELRRAIALSLQANTTQQASSSSEAAASDTPGTSQDLDKEAIRNKRLAFLEKQQGPPK